MRFDLDQFEGMTDAEVRRRLNDLGELERFANFLLQLNQATRAGASRAEAIVAIYPDAYPDDKEFDACRATKK